MKILLAFIAVALPCMAQPPTATIIGPLALPSGALYTGSVTLSALASPNVGAVAVLTGVVKCSVSVGAMACSLVPGSYSAVYPSGFSEYWVIPTAATYTVASIRTLVTPTPSLLLSLAQLSTAGATNGQVLGFNGAIWTPTAAGSGTGPQGPAGATGPTGATGATGPQGPAGAGSTLTIRNGGTPVGSRAILDFTTGSGIVHSSSDNGTVIGLQTAIDSSVVQTRINAQAGTSLYCGSLSASASTYTCAMAPTLQAYTKGMVLDWQPNIAGAGGATTLNVDLLGAVAVKEADGTTNPTASDIAANRLYQLWYDGTVFRLLSVAANAPAAANYQYATGPTTALTMNTTDVAVYSAANVPALAAGSCYQIYFNLAAFPGGTIKIKVDSTVIATPIAGGASATNWIAGINYCNDQGSQSVQRTSYIQNQFGGGPTIWISNVDGVFTTPAGVNWNTTHTISLTVNNGSGTQAGNSFVIR